MSNKRTEAIQLLASNQDEKVKYQALIALYNDAPKKNTSFLKRIQNTLYTPKEYESLVYHVQQAFEPKIKGTEICNAVGQEPAMSTEGVDEKSDFELSPEQKEEKANEIKLREEFPRLKEGKTPDKIFIAIGRKLDAFKLLEAINLDLHSWSDKPLEEQEANKEVLSQLGAKAVEVAEENESLYQELKHWNETGDVLGKHPLFWAEAIEKEVEKMTTAQLAKEPENARKWLSTAKSNLEKETDEAKKEDMAKKITKREYKLQLVIDKLNQA